MTKHNIVIPKSFSLGKGHALQLQLFLLPLVVGFLILVLLITLLILLIFLILFMKVLLHIVLLETQVLDSSFGERLSSNVG